jgi:myo-inositol-1(or 4)-monophosphatase
MTDSAPGTAATDPAMDKAAIDERFATAQRVMAEAAQVALAFSRDLSALTILEKGTQDLVSEADRQTEAAIKTAIAEAFPQDGFVGEESGSERLEPGRGVWVVDPIDGTQPFLLGLPTWCISIAFVVDGEIEFGLVTNPATDDVYAARRGAGATRNGRPIQVRSAASLTEGLTGVGANPSSHAPDVATIMGRLIEAGGMYHRIGSGALSLCYLATGQLIGYVEMHINAWDCLAALCICTEAGARTSDFLASHGLTGGGRLVVGNPTLYPRLAALMP